MLSRQEEEVERRATLENDRKVLEQQRGSTFHQHGLAQADEIAQGRFRAVGSPTVIASKPSVAAQYPAASAAHQTELPPEQPLGYRVDDMPGYENPADVSVTASAEPGPALDGDAHAPADHADALRADDAGPSSDGERDV